MGWAYDLLTTPDRVATLRGQWLKGPPPAPLHPGGYSPLIIGDPVLLSEVEVFASAEWKWVRLRAVIPFFKDSGPVAGFAIIDPDGIPLYAVGIEGNADPKDYPGGLLFLLSVYANN